MAYNPKYLDLHLSMMMQNDDGYNVPNAAII